MLGVVVEDLGHGDVAEFAARLLRHGLGQRHLACPRSTWGTAHVNSPASRLSGHSPSIIPLVDARNAGGHTELQRR